MSYKSQPRFSADRWNRLRQEGVEMFKHYKALCLDELMVDGLPPFTAQLEESEEYHKLVTLALTNDPRYMNSKEAKARLAELSMRYGEPPERKVPIGQSFPINPAGEAAAMTSPIPPTMLP